jgi:hypothetical protein
VAEEPCVICGEDWKGQCECYVCGGLLCLNCCVVFDPYNGRESVCEHCPTCEVGLY